jgi:hypothetical protein
VGISTRHCGSRSTGFGPPRLLSRQPSCAAQDHEAGLGVLTVDQQADNWRLAIARVRKLVERWGIRFPAISELDIEGADVGDINAEDIIPVF